MAASTSLSGPSLYTVSDLRSSPALVRQITDLVNDAFTRAEKPDPVKWGQGELKRFENDELYFDMMGREGAAVVIFDTTAEDRKVVAVAAVLPWQGGWTKQGAGVEEGWELKAVAVDGDAKYLRRGLAMQLYAFLEQHLVMESKRLGISTTGRKLDPTDRLTLWVQAAECINGPYWRRKGYQMVRRHVVEPPTWGAQTSFELVVLRKDVPFRLTVPVSTRGLYKGEEPARHKGVVN